MLLLFFFSTTLQTMLVVWWCFLCLFRHHPGRFDILCVKTLTYPVGHTRASVVWAERRSLEMTCFCFYSCFCCIIACCERKRQQRKNENWYCTAKHNQCVTLFDMSQVRMNHTIGAGLIKMIVIIISLRYIEFVVHVFLPCKKFLCVIVVNIVISFELINTITLIRTGKKKQV